MTKGLFRRLCAAGVLSAALSIASTAGLITSASPAGAARAQARVPALNQTWNATVDYDQDWYSPSFTTSSATLCLVTNFRTVNPDWRGDSEYRIFVDMRTTGGTWVNAYKTGTWKANGGIDKDCLTVFRNQKYRISVENKGGWLYSTRDITGKVQAVSMMG